MMCVGAGGAGAVFRFCCEYEPGDEEGRRVVCFVISPRGGHKLLVRVRKTEMAKGCGGLLNVTAPTVRDGRCRQQKR